MCVLQAVVKMNGREAFVFDKIDEIKYIDKGNYLFGENDNGIFLGCYKFEMPWSGFKAFGGCKFDIHMKNGEIKIASGQWWDAGWSEYEKYLGEEIISVPINTIDKLKDCYVFCGGAMTKSNFEKIRKSYTGKIYEYKEYESFLKDNN